MNIETLNIDIETYSPLDLTKVGVYQYAAHPDFKILLFAYKINEGPTQIIDLNEEDLPYALMEALIAKDIKKYAFNAMFERICLSSLLDEKNPFTLKGNPRFLQPYSWHCTAAHSSYLGLPHKLGQVGAVLKLEEIKDPAGMNLINYFCKPSRTKDRERNLPENDPQKWEEFKSYCIQDVNSEYAIAQAIKNYPLPERERALYILDQLINDRGVRMDRNLIENAIHTEGLHKEVLKTKICGLTGIENPNSYIQLKKWLDKEGLPVSSLDKEHVENALSVLIPGEQDHIKEVLEARQLLGKTATKKYEAIQRTASKQDILRGMFGYYRTRTGRWASYNVQLHNLKTTGDLTAEDLTNYRNQLLAQSLPIDNDLPDILSKLIRTSFIPREGKKFLVVDFSAIEARVLAWLAGEFWRLDLFKRGGKLYEETASMLTGKPIEEITKDSPERKRGKVAELALGYQGGVKALERMGGRKLGLEEDEMDSIKNTWRSQNANICQFWYNCQEAFEMAIMGHTTTLGKVTFRKGPGVIFIDLPAYRHLVYLSPKIEYDKDFERDSITYEGLNSITHKWERLKSYGGKIVENITQAAARDCLAEIMLRLKKEYIVLHVHDEIVLEVEKDEELQGYIDIFEKPIPWAPDLPLKADGYFSSFYKK